MCKEITYNQLVIQINYDPIEEYYYCGIPGYTIPTIYVGKTEKEVQESAYYLLSEYLDFCQDQGYCHEKKIRYDAQEAYSSGWIVREVDSQNKQPKFKKQMERCLDDNEIQAFMSTVDVNHPNYSDILRIYEELNKLSEMNANLAENQQISRMKLINLAKESGHNHLVGNGIEVLKVNRLGAQRDSSV